ncbi:MFS transporter [Nitratireductor mangrovi]|uniref:MFS transporter n=1 Tax=Nitratireductor mangrovi TaxID=2599600 RepID=A0A5B8L5M7_9HYPH|nr:MFS transporter [Nitratireductor mangrovi]QDZ03237.2 MFS transporter [Nitratireductor mangrovi]
MSRKVVTSLAPVKSLLGGTILFTAGNSLLGVVLPLRMEAADYPVALTGVVMASYYLGLALGGYRAKRVVLRIGHIRAFSAFAAFTAAVCLAYGFFPTPVVWIILRVINGFCIAGMSTSIESWLNDRSSNETRGRVLGYYMLAVYLAVALGQTLINLAPDGSTDHLMLASALTGLALIPIAVTRLGEPNLSELRVLTVRRLYEASRIGLVGAGVAGILVGSFYALGVVFARQIGLSVSETALFMSTVVLGGLGFQVPVGMLADRFDRRIVMSCILIAVGASWGLLSNALAGGLPLSVLIAMALAFGGAISSVYPLCVAQTFDRLERKYYVAASGRLLMVYSIGATIGPLFASALMSLYGPASFFLFESAVAVIYALFVLLRMRVGRSLPKEAREKFVPLPDISQAGLTLDPRTEPDRKPAGVD